MTRRLILSACALALAGAASVQPALAQMGPPPMGPLAAERRAQVARDMHILLRLRPDQEAAWQAFEAAMVPPEPPPADGAAPKALTTPQRLEEMVERRAEMDARQAKWEAATRSFYAALSPDQQQAFDALARLRGPMAPPHGPGGPRGPIGGPEGAPPPGV
ncbi:Spy/CpxP family protein refolding chaperone [Phenylobacterium sp.]|uniref:Spy/CpxP family protein refolding chaperone n=1 Tax=Phenylobacterium sp. TaxID=1871053 RepID=UPI0035B027B5